jgi:hypothetical protein
VVQQRAAQEATDRPAEALCLTAGLLGSSAEAKEPVKRTYNSREAFKSECTGYGGTFKTYSSGMTGCDWGNDRYTVCNSNWERSRELRLLHRLPEAHRGSHSTAGRPRSGRPDHEGSLDHDKCAEERDQDRLSPVR